jgi:HK97 family phage prohead protease
MRMISPDRFAKMAWDVRKRGGGRLPDDLVVTRSFATEAEIPSDGSRQLRYTITTDSVDRQMDTLAVDGWDLKSYLRNPVVLWGHKHDLVIGRALDITRDGNALKATVEFQPADMPIVGDWAEYAYRSGTTGFVRSTSVGFRPIEWEFTEDEERGGDSWMPGIDFRRQELTEFSVVGVPANPEALIEAPALPIGAGAASLDPENQRVRQAKANVRALRGARDAIRARRFAYPA